jgi:hypothetical protein
MAEVALKFKARPYPGATDTEMLVSEVHVSADTGVDPTETFNEDKRNSMLAL